jgi:hypothetical protein
LKVAYSVELWKATTTYKRVCVVKPGGDANWRVVSHGLLYEVDFTKRKGNPGVSNPIPVTVKKAGFHDTPFSNTLKDVSLMPVVDKS